MPLPRRDVASPAEPLDLDFDGVETKSERVVKGAIQQREGGTIELLDDVAHLLLRALPYGELLRAQPLDQLADLPGRWRGGAEALSDELDRLDRKSVV